MAPVILYDLPSKSASKPWSLNPWKTRMALNYKGIEYKTEWIEYPDLEPTLKGLGLPPNDKNDPGYFVDYTSPAVRFEDGTMVMDSWKIAAEMEKRYPTPSLHLDDPIVAHIQGRITDALKPLRANVIPKVATNLLNPSSKEYFERTRAETSGLPLDRWEKELGDEKCWEKAEQPAREVAELLKKNGGPFFLGQKVSYADFILVSALHFLKCVDEKLFERFVAFDSVFVKLYDASKEWLKKDD